MKVFYLLLLLATTLLSGCASTFLYPQRPGTDTSEPKATADVYVIRPSVSAQVVKVGVYQDGKLIGDLGARNYLHWRVAADGQPVTLTSKTENRSDFTFTPVADSTYYLRAKIQPYGFLIAQTKLKPMEEEKAKSLLTKFQRRGKLSGDINRTQLRP